MKRILMVLLCFLLVAVTAFGESSATPTDLEEEKEYVEIEDDDWGEITIEFDRQVYIDVTPKDGITSGDLVTFTAILVNFQPNDVFTFEWQYSTDESNWNVIEGANEQNYSFNVNNENSDYFWRVKVIIQEG